MGFTLFFYAWTNDVPPSEDLKHVDNREWAWQRNYTELEVQYAGGNVQSGLEENEAGFEGMTVAVEEELFERLVEKMEIIEEGVGKIKDPDGLEITILKQC